MESLEVFYKSKVQKYNNDVQGLKKKLMAISLLRLLVFLLTTGAVYMLFENVLVVIVIGLVGTAVFLLLLNKYTDLKKKRDHFRSLALINQDELDYLKGNYPNKYNGTNFKDSKHYYCNDIDLFGDGSFFQYLNRTSIDKGTEFLAEILLENDINNVTSRQDAVRELSQITGWRQNFIASARNIKVETDSSSIEQWINNYEPFLKDKIYLLPILFSLLSFSVFGLIYFNVLSLNFLLYWLVLGFIVTGLFIKKINSLSSASDKTRDTIRQFAVLLNQIESQDFKSKVLREQKIKLTKDGKTAYNLFQTFSASLDALDNRNNFIYAIIGNGFFLTDIRNSYRVEKWIVANKSKISEWFKVIAFFDAHISLGNFAFNHPTYTYPVIQSNSIIEAEELGHPLLKSANRVDNSITIDEGEFFIVTGANMAGKSTFLRTVSLYIVMANVGLPVCAGVNCYSPIKLITSMRTSDSLKDESSYFFSELTRLKFIVDKIKTEPYFIVLDEILKGTNSTDKAIGSKKFVEKLVSGNATGIIATHDLSLCDIEENLDDVKNYFFDAQIIDDELFFDYKFKQGICQNMNASFLLKKMEII